MNALSAQWEKAKGRFNAFSKRERTMLAAAMLGGSLLLGFSLLIDPNLVQARAAKRLADQQASQVGDMQAQLQALQAQLRIDPDAARKLELAGLKNDLATVEGSLKRLESGLVPPEQMNILLERLLARHATLRLVSLKSLPPVNLAERAQESAKTAEGDKFVPLAPSDALGLYKHGVELRLEGSYADLHAWLSQLEASQQKLLWGEVRLVVADHPRAQLTLTVFTLSSDKAWLAI